MCVCVSVYDRKQCWHSMQGSVNRKHHRPTSSSSYDNNLSTSQ